MRQEKRVVPVLVQSDADRPVYLEAQQYIPFDPYPDGLRDLLSAIGGDQSAVLPQRYRATHVTAPPLPQNFVPRPAELERLRKALINDASDRRIALTAVRAMGGIGKTVLAQALCGDRAIRDAFPDGVIWATLGQDPTDLRLATELRVIVEALGDHVADTAALRECSIQFRTSLAAKAALIVLDDVWNPRDVQPFLADAPRARLLLTTRQRGVVKSTGAQEFSLDVLEPDQARTLLAHWSQTAEEKLPPIASDIIEECGRLPLAIAMIGAVVRGETGDPWGRALRKLKNADLEKIRIQFPDYPYPDLFRAIQVSVDSLESEYRSRYLDFAVFRPDTLVPQEVLETLWDTDADSVADVVDAWVGASLATRLESGMTLHDLQMDYVRKMAVDLPGLHGRLLDRYRGRCPDGWASGPDDGYFFTWLPYHLLQADRQGGIAGIASQPGVDAGEAREERGGLPARRLRLPPERSAPGVGSRCVAAVRARSGE